MAYLDIGTDGIIAAPRFGTPLTEAAGGKAGFSPLEWLVIALAERDGKRSLAEPGRIAAALHRLFGGSGRPRLANPQLEALRRFAVMTWHDGGNVAPSERAAFIGAGYTAAQANMLVESVFAGRGRRLVGAA